MKYTLIIFATLFSLSTFAAPTKATTYSLPKTIPMFQLSLDPAVLGDLDLKLAVDLTGNAAVLKGKFNRHNENGNVQGSCQFSSPLTAAQTKTLKSLLAKVRYCKASSPEDIAMDPEYMESLFIYSVKPTSKNEGRGAEINKYYMTGWSPQKYLCQGGKELYQFMKSVTAQKAPKSCPQKHTRLFSYTPQDYQ